MIRKLAIALSLLGVCFAGFVHALGLGEATVKSALNQPLNAEIELVNTAGLSLNEILPGLATREEFQRANVDRVYFLSDIRFEVKTNAQGKAVIVLTSKKPVREPFLNFLVELIWPSGRLLREYALLIDPPLFTETTPVQASTPVSTTVSGDVVRLPRESAVKKTPILSTSATIQSATYGPTTASDTLWEIALKARPDRSVSPQQVMLAIQDLNPNAFIDGNINKMKAGQVLRLPSLDEVKTRDRYQAIQMVIAQNEAHTGKKYPSIAQGSKVETVAEQKRVAPSSTTSDELKLVVADEGKAGITNSANSGQSAQSGSDTKLAVTLEKLDKASIENKELTSKVGDLEEQLATLQRLLTLKNDQLAAIQAQMREADQAKLQSEADQAAAPAGTSVPADEVASAQDLVGEQAITAGQDPAPDLAIPSQSTEGDAGAPQTPETATDASELASTDAAAEQSADTPAAAAVDSVKPAIETVPPAAEQKRQPGSDNIIERIINNPVYLSITLLAVLVVVFILWLVSRHNARKEQEFQSNSDEFSEAEHTLYDLGPDGHEMDFDTVDDKDLVSDGADASAVDADYGDQDEEESQDIIAEANAYISYGRMDQAANVLENAISNDPVRTDYRLKLLSVYKDLGDRQAFERQFSELEAIQDQSALKKAAKIREEMLDEELVAMETKESEMSFDRDVQDQDKAKKREDVALESEQEAMDNDLKSFDFDEVSLNDAEDDIDLSSELDLDSLDLDEPKATDVSKTKDTNKASQELDDDPALEMNDALDLGAELADVEGLNDIDVPDDITKEDDFDDSILDVDLEDLDLNAELDQESEIDLSEKSRKDEPGADDLVVSDDILEEAIQELDARDEMPLDEDLGDGDDFDFLSGTDEASTKLDLARAYIDMGDIEGAKDILQEVVKEGSEAQQNEAKELIASLD